MNTPENENNEARAMWFELESHTSFDAMNELHDIEMARLQDCHEESITQLEGQIIWLQIIREEHREKIRGLRRRIDYLYLALFACALVIAYLVVKG